MTETLSAAEFRKRLAGPKPKRRNAHPEQTEQTRWIEYLDQHCPEIVMFAVSNGFKRSRAEASAAKAMGQRAGVWDLVGILPQGGILFIEAKAPGLDAEKALTPEQRAFRTKAEPWGAYFEPCASLERFIDILREYWPRVRHREPCGTDALRTAVKANAKVRRR